MGKFMLNHITDGKKQYAAFSKNQKVQTSGYQTISFISLIWPWA